MKDFMDKMERSGIKPQLVKHYRSFDPWSRIFYSRIKDTFTGADKHSLISITDDERKPEKKRKVKEIL